MLNELEISRKLKNPKLMGFNLQKILLDAGWQPLGFGAEGGVAAHPSKPYVLKIFPTDSLYTHFLQMVDSAPDNPHFPRLNRRSRQIPGTHYSYVRMEKLNHVNTYDVATSFPELNCLVIQLYKKFGINHMGGPWGWAYNNASWDPLTSLINCNEMQLQPSAVRAFDLLYQKAQQLGHRRLDLSLNNFMSRGNTWVITDPFI